MSLTRRLLVIVVIALLPAFAIQAYLQLDTRRSLEAEIHEAALAQARLGMSELSQILEGVRALLIAVSEAPAIRARNTADCVSFLGRLIPQMSHLVSVAVMDLDGRLICRQVPDASDQGFADRSYFRDALATGGFVAGEHTVARLSGMPVLPVALPMRDDDGKLSGVAAAAIDLGWLGRHLAARALPAGGSITVADRNGVILAREPRPGQFIGTRIPEGFQRLVNAARPGTLELTSQDGTRRIVGYVPVTSPPGNLYVSAGLATEAAFAALDRAMLSGLAFIAAGAGLAVLGAWFAVGRFIQSPLQAMLTAARRWEEGAYTSRTGLGPRDGELGVLGGAFDRMADQIGRRTAEREAAIGQRDLMLKELSHRVKNNLQMIVSLLRLQAHRPGAEHLVEPFDQACRRIQAIADVHSSLYQGDEIGRVEFKGFLEVLCERLRASFLGDWTSPVTLTVDAEPAVIDLDHVVPLGLLVNELITNALKHAFPHGAGGTIDITFKRRAGSFVLTVSDSGRGLPPIAEQLPDGLGSRLIQALAAQLGGTIRREQRSGLSTEITFAALHDGGRTALAAA